MALWRTCSGRRVRQSRRRSSWRRPRASSPIAIRWAPRQFSYNAARRRLPLDSDLPTLVHTSSSRKTSDLTQNPTTLCVTMFVGSFAHFPTSPRLTRFFPRFRTAGFTLLAVTLFLCRPVYKTAFDRTACLADGIQLVSTTVLSARNALSHKTLLGCKSPACCRMMSVPVRNPIRRVPASPRPRPRFCFLKAPY